MDQALGNALSAKSPTAIYRALICLKETTSEDKEVQGEFDAFIVPYDMLCFDETNQLFLLFSLPNTATALKYNTLLEELYLGDNDLQPADGVSIGAMLSANKTLQLLDLRNNGFRVRLCFYFIQGVSKLSCHVYGATMPLTSCSINWLGFYTVSYSW